MVYLAHHLIYEASVRTPQAPALISNASVMSYTQLWRGLSAAARAWRNLGLSAGARVAIWHDKCPEFVMTIFGANYAGAAFVPVNPALKAVQVQHILQDCSVEILVTSWDRLQTLVERLDELPGLKHVVLLGRMSTSPWAPQRSRLHHWDELMVTSVENVAEWREEAVENDLAAIFYTSGSTGKPKGVAISHRNLVVGASSVALYLGLHSNDRIFSALPLSFDAGLSQLTTAFHVGASVILHNYFQPQVALKALEEEKATVLTAVPPLWSQLLRTARPGSVNRCVRLVANTGGHMPLATLKLLQQFVPEARVFLMYGLTEAFRSTYLDPEQLAVRPNSIGKAIPNAQILILNERGERCAPNEPGELVHRGPLVALGYWNDPDRTAERFKPLDNGMGTGLSEIAVFSGDTVRQDDEGYLYYIGRRDDMIKSSGYRISPSEIEEVVYASELVHDAVAIGIEHPDLGQSIVVVAHGDDPAGLNTEALLALCRRKLPAYMVPHHIVWESNPLTRNPNGKIDRQHIRSMIQRLGAQAQNPSDRAEVSALYTGS
jgi:acyl-CoA ligase (AMP-forming) (exosortase A-associated)